MGFGFVNAANAAHLGDWLVWMVGGSVGKRALPTAVLDFPGFSPYELGDFAGAVG
jgi:hypothetical protein